MLPGKHSLGGTGHILHQWAQVGFSPHGSSPSHYQQCFSPWSTSLVAQAPLSCQILPSQAWQLSRHPCCLECSIVLLLKLGSIKPPPAPRELPGLVTCLDFSPSDLQLLEGWIHISSLPYPQCLPVMSTICFTIVEKHQQTFTRKTMLKLPHSSYQTPL